MPEQAQIRRNAIKGCFYREVGRFLNDPVQTIFSEVFSSLLLFAVMYLINPRQIILVMPGLLIFSSFNVVFSNLKMTLFVGRIERVINYQLSAPVSRVSLYFVYILSSMLRSCIISCILVVIFKIFSPGLRIHSPASFILFFALANAAFASLSALIILHLRNWNEAGAVENYLKAPLLYLSGCFFSILAVPQSLVNFIVANPLYHFVNIARYLFSGILEYPIGYSAFYCAALSAASICVCVYFFHKGIRLLK